MEAAEYRAWAASQATKIGYRITYLKDGREIGSTVIDSLEGELADKTLSYFGIRGMAEPDDFTITEGTFRPHPQTRGAVVFTPKSA